ncbi:MAG: hypothetical protein AAFQ94_24395 [Bacteroidota bacterium]
MHKLLIFSLLACFISTGILGQDSQCDQVVYIQTDQAYYLAGEPIHYSTFLFNSGNNTFEQLNEIIYVGLTGNNVKVTDRILSSKGMGNGTIQIPDSTKSGDLILIAYTNDMKGTDIKTWYKKRIKVFNQNDQKLANCDEKNNPDIRFYPEYGKLIDGLPSKIVLMTDQNSKLQKSDTLVVSKGERVVFRSSADAINLQSFEITPDSAEKIQAFMLSNNDTINLSFPAIQPDGVSMSVENIPQLSYVRVKTQHTSALQKNYQLQLIKDDDNYQELPVSISNNAKDLIIPYEKLQEGINKIVLSDETGNLVGRLVLINKATPSKVLINKKMVKPREAIKLTFKVPNFANGALSISKRTKSNIQQDHLLDFLKLKSKLPVYQSIDNFNQIENLLIANQGKYIEKTPSLKKANPSDSMRIKGQLINALTNEPLASNTVTVTFPEQEEFYTTATDSEGRIDLSVKIGAGQYFGILHTFDDKVFNKIIFKPEFEAESTDIAIDLCNNITYSGVPERWTRLIENQVIKAAYNEESSTDIDIDLSMEYLEDLYDEEVILDEYIEQKSMKTVFSGIVPQVSISNNPNRPVKMYPMESSFSFGNTPLFYVDGIPTYDENWVLQMQPSSIEKISVIASAWKLAIFGKAGSCGIISIETKEKNQKPPVSSNIFRMTGYSYYEEEPVSLKANTDSRIPAIQTLLYWNPKLDIRKGTDELTIKTGDETGTYVVTFEGFTVDGKPLTLTESFEIKY